MKKRLNQYTMAQFIDIACGDYTHIGADTETSKQVAASLMEQYNNLADPATARMTPSLEPQFSRLFAMSFS